MKSRASLMTVTLLVATGVSFGAGISYSPITCGCVDPWWALAEFIGHPEIKAPAQLTAQLVQDGLERKLAKKVVVLDTLPWVGVPENCAETTSGSPSIHCRWWIWEHRNLSGAVAAKKGFQVRIDLHGNRQFLRAEVSEIEYIDHQISGSDT